MDYFNDELERMATNVAQYAGTESEVPLDDICGHQQVPALRSQPSNPTNRGKKSNTSHLIKLCGPLSTPEQIQAVAGLPTLPPILEGKTEEDEQAKTKFCCLHYDARDTIKAWLTETGVPQRDQPHLVRVCMSAKELSPHSPYPTLSLDTTLPQHRPHNNTTLFRPLQDEWPLWYFFYGTLADEDKLVDFLGLAEDEYPVLEPATVRGGIIKTWKGKYKALVDGTETVSGWAYKAKCQEHEVILRTYEGERYEVVRCKMEVMGREGEIWGLTFRCADVDGLIK